MRRAVLRTTGLTKRFGPITAVRDLNLELYEGEVYGLLGPNGSGKSTTVSMILGLVEPDAGDLEVFGQPLRENLWSCLKRIGAVIETPAFYPYLSGRDNLLAMARSVGDVSEEAVDEALERVGLGGRARDRYQAYSLGMKQRLGIASTLIRDPALVILDEPTNGLDPAGTKEVRELIPTLAREGRSVLLCSHLLHEVQQVCDRVGILKAGRLLSQGTVSTILRRDGVLLVRTEAVAQARRVLERLDWVTSVEQEGGYLMVSAPVGAAAEVNAALAREGIYLSELRPRELSLESFFLEVMEERGG
jgi:ABC-2 type transport system ATP-binding protein